MKWKLETPYIDSTLSTNGNTHHLRQGNISDVSMPSIMVCQERYKVTKRQKLVMSEEVSDVYQLKWFYS